jgi:hypothetical protein
MDRPKVRASDAERDRTVELLRERSRGPADLRGAGRPNWHREHGDVVLDLRDARVTAPEVTIDAGTVFGDIDLLVPEGVVVEVRSRTFVGDVRQEAGDAGSPGAPRIILEGGSVFGDVKVRARRLREKLAERLLGGRA